MYHWYNQLNVPHPFTTDFLFGHLDTTSITYNTFITDTLVFSTITFIVFYWTKNTFAKQAITFWLIRTVVDSLRLQYLSHNFFPKYHLEKKD